MQKINVNSLLRLSTNNQVRELQIILGNKNLNKLGEINNVDYSSASVSHKLMSSDDFSFVIYKNQNINGNEVNCSLWDDIDDLKLIYVKEYNEWFQIQVTPDDSEVITKKTITATSLCEAELSQIIIEGTEINTSDDPNVGTEANATTFYNAEDTSHSLLHRILEKAPHYTIAHVDETLMHIQRSFSIDGTSIYDFMTGTLTDEFGCLFLFDTNTRSIYVYDMETACLGDDCGYRSEDDFAVCPKCGGTIVHKAYGTDTNIFIDKTNLGENIQLTSDIDSVKNCFKVSGGDDNINAAIRQANPNGTNYFYYFNETTRKDMQSVPGLVEKLDAYDALVEEYNTTRKYKIESSFVNAYNGIVSYIKTYYPDKDISAITNSYTGWSKIPLLYNNINDTISYLQHGMLPTWHMSDITAQTQVELLTGVNMSFVAVDKDKVHLENLTLYTANSSVLSMAKSIINTSIYNVEIVSSSLSSQTWTGRFKVTNRSNEEDVAESTSNIVIEISNDVIAFINQKIKKSIARLEIDGIKDLFDIDDINLFKAELHKYCASQLTSYSSAYQTALSVLSEQGVSSEASDLHDSIYLPYYNRMLAVESELSHRNSQIDSIKELQAYLSNLITSTNLALNFESYLGTDLWKVFVSYRREDTYSNGNYISDGLSNEEILTKANELIEVAKNELYKSGERQFTITAALQNLLLLVDENGNRIFAPILDNFTLGNFIKIKIDGKLYNVRLTEVIINYGDLSSIAVTFTNASHANMDKYDTSLEEIKAQTQTLATTYGGIVKQANQGEKANQTLLKMQTEGIDSAIYNMNSSNGSISIDKHGILLRNYDDVTQQYEDEQSRLGYNYFIYTTDNWKTGDLALGKQKFTLNNVEHNEYGLNSKFVISGKVIAGNIYSADYTTDSNGLLIKGTHWDLLNNNADLFDGKIRYRANTNTLTMNGVTIDWNNSTPPAISDIDGLNASLSNLGTQIDGKIDTWNQPLDPSASWNDEDKVKHKGDIWYNGNQTKIWGGSSWTTTTDTALKAIADSKKQVFTSTPIVPYYVGDLWITSTTSNAELKVCKTTRTSGSYATSDWVASLKYTDDTVANQANKVANSAYTLADTAKAIGDDLVNVLGYDGTKITGTYIYSPVISGVDLRGGHLFIGDDKKVGAYAEITSDGVLNAAGANISGSVITNEFYVMDSNSLNTAQKVWRWNINGLGYSSSGVDGPYDTAITMDGTILGKFISAHSISTEQLQANSVRFETLDSDLQDTYRLIEVKVQTYSNGLEKTIVTLNGREIFGFKKIGDGGMIGVKALYPDTLEHYREYTFNMNYLTDVEALEYTLYELNAGNYVIIVASSNESLLERKDDSLKMAIRNIGGTLYNLNSNVIFPSGYALIGHSKAGDGNGVECYISDTSVDSVAIPYVSANISKQGTIVCKNSSKDSSPMKALFEMKVGKDENDKIVSMINEAADIITLTANRFVLESELTKIKDGIVEFLGGKIGNFTISSEGLSSKTSYTYPQYFQSDIDRIQQIMLGNVTPTAADYERLDTDGSQYIDLFDMVRIKKMIQGLDPYEIKGEIKIHNDSIKETFTLTRTEGSGKGMKTIIGCGNIYTDDMVAKTINCLETFQFSHNGVPYRFSSAMLKRLYDSFLV